jgi:hypothetical protein
LKTAHDAASYECITKGKDMIVISQEIIGFSNIQLIFSCIEKDGPDMQQ